jgi:hypothetical protein
VLGVVGVGLLSGCIWTDGSAQAGQKFNVYTNSSKDMLGAPANLGQLRAIRVTYHIASGTSVRLVAQTATNDLTVDPASVTPGGPFGMIRPGKTFILPSGLCRTINGQPATVEATAQWRTGTTVTTEVVQTPVTVGRDCRR